MKKVRAKRSRRSRVWRRTKKIGEGAADGLDVADGCCGCLVVGPLVLAASAATVVVAHAVR